MLNDYKKPATRYYVISTWASYPPSTVWKNAYFEIRECFTDKWHSSYNNHKDMLKVLFALEPGNSRFWDKEVS